MKKILLFVITLCFFGAGYCQLRIVIFDVEVYPVDKTKLKEKGIDGVAGISFDSATKVRTAVAPMSINNNQIHKGTTYTETYRIPVFTFKKNATEGLVFRKTGEFEDYYVIKFLPFKVKEDEKSFSKAVTSFTEKKGQYELKEKISIDPVTKTDDSKDDYLITKKDYDSQTKDFENKKGSWNLGALVLPVKFRPFASNSGFFDFSQEFTLGAALQFTLTHNWKKNLTSGIFFSPAVSSIEVDTLVTKGITSGDTKKITAFSPTIGYYWEKGKIQLGIFMGIDFPSRKIQKEWVYRNRPWFAIGVGFSLFKISEGTKDGGKNLPPEN